MENYTKNRKYLYAYIQVFPHAPFSCRFEMQEKIQLKMEIFGFVFVHFTLI